MFSLPKETEVNKQIAKTKLFTIDAIKNSEKTVIDKKVSTLHIVNQISATTIPAITDGARIKSINFILLELKDDMNNEDLAIIFKLINQTMILILHNNEKYFAVAINNDILLKNEIDLNYKLVLKGNDLDVLYDNIIIDLFNIKITEGKNLDTQIELNKRVEELKEKVCSLELKRNKEVQFNKKVEIMKEINMLKKQLEELQ